MREFIQYNLKGKMNSSFSHSTKIKKVTSLKDSEVYYDLGQRNLDRCSQQWEEKRKERLISSLIEEQSESQNNPESQNSKEIGKAYHLKGSNKSSETPEENQKLIQICSEMSLSKSESEAEDENEIFKKNRVGILNYFKGKHILKEIIDGIEEEELLGLDQSIFLEFMFLISLRCYNYFSKARAALEKVKNTNIKEEMQYLYAYQFKAKSKFRSYSEMLNNQQKKIRKRLLSFKEMFYISEKDKKKYRFLDGFEGLDYTQCEQISFTFTNYMEKVLNSSSINSKYFKNHRLKKALKSYKIFCNIKQSEVESEKGLEWLRDKILIDQQ